MAPPNPAIAADEREHRDLGRQQVDAEGRARGWAVLHREQPTAEGAAAHQHDAEAEDAEHHRDHDHEPGVLGEVEPEEAERIGHVLPEHLQVGEPAPGAAEDLWLVEDDELRRGARRQALQAQGRAPAVAARGAP